ncbi:MAG: orotidine-5'-phosphate decarboxylase [Deinococcales bacterium]
MKFGEALVARIQAQNSRLCLGLDPRLELHGTIAKLAQHTLDVLEACAPFVACIKPQVAFFEVLGIEGLQLLEKVCATARSMGLPVILDAKRGDIASTASAYAQAWLAGQHAGSALTVNPYLGFDTLEPFLAVAQKNNGAIFVLVRTSNSGSGDLQLLQTNTGTVASAVAKHLEQLAANNNTIIGAVIGATHPAELETWRKQMPNVFFLLPGLGAQGAQAKDVAPAFDAKGMGAVVSASRAIQYASKNLSVLAAKEAAQHLRLELQSALGLNDDSNNCNH